MTTIYDRVKASAPRLMKRFKNPQQIEIQEKQTVSDGMGGTTVSWVTVATVDAVVMPMSARERLEADRLESSVTHKVYMLADDVTALTATHRLKFGARVFNNARPQDIAEAGAWVRVDAEEGAAT